jgi:hypothetical protein
MGKHARAHRRAAEPRRAPGHHWAASALPALVPFAVTAAVLALVLDGLAANAPPPAATPAHPALTPAATPAHPAVTTLLGGAQWDEVTGVAVDGAGDRFVSGSTMSGTVSGGLAEGPGGLVDAFVAELSPTGAVLWTVVVGGSGVDTGQAVAVGRDGAVYLTGRTASADFPVLHAAQPTIAGTACSDSPCPDAFVARFSPDGQLLYSTYLGGSLDEEGRGIAADAQGNAYVVGNTASTDRPTVSALQERAAGSPCPGDLPCPTDVFVSKLSPDGSHLAYSTYLGGSQEDTAAGIAVSSDGTAFITGTTQSSDFPVTGAPRPPTGTACGPPPGVPCRDVFVTALAPDGAHARYSTLLGGSGQARAGGIAVDAQGRADVVGSTQSTDFPTARPAQAALGNWSDNPAEQSSDTFLTRLSADGGTLDFSTYIGGRADDVGLGVAVDPAGDIYATGSTDSPDFPIHDPTQPNLAGRTDAFVTELAGANGALVRSTVLGGTGDDRANAVAVGPAGSVVVAGRTVSSDFPASPARQGGRQPEDYDAFVTTLG